MSTLLKVCFSAQSKRCFSKSNSVLSKIKFDYGRTQLTCSHLLTRSITTQKVEPAEKITPTVIYQGFLGSQVKSIKVFSLITSAIGVFGWPLVYFSEGHDTSVTKFFLAGIALYSLSTPFIIHHFTKRYVLKIEYDADEDKYTALTSTILCMPQKIEFRLEDVTRLDNPRMFTTIKVKGMPLFFDSSSFSEPEHYLRLLAYDQPIDFKFSEITDDSDSQSEAPKARLKQKN